MKIIVNNPSIDNLEMSYLSQAYAAGVTAITVRNNERFVNGKKIMIGVMGHERTEISSINGAVTPGTPLTIVTTVSSHDADDPIYQLKYDQIKIYRSTTGVAGAYNTLATVNVDVDNSSLKTIYDDTAGLSSYYYKISYYDSAGSVETELSDPIPGTGYPRGTAGSLVNEFFEEISDMTQQQMTVPEVIGLMNEVNDDIISQSRRPYRFLKTSSVLDITGDNNRVALPTDLVKFDRILYTGVDGDRTDAYRRVSIQELEYLAFDNTLNPSDDMLLIAIDETTNELVIWPTPDTTQSDKIKIFYWKKFDEITSLASAFETPNGRIYKVFLLAKYYRKRAVKEPSYINISDRYMQDYNTEIVKLQRYNRLDMGSPQSFLPDTRSSRGLRRF